MRNRLLALTVLFAGSVLSLACANARRDYRAQPADPELLHTAVHQLTGVIVYDIFSPPQASRVYAYASVAAYETLRPDHPGYRTLAGQLNGLTPVPAPSPDSEYYLPLASVHAFMTVGKALTFSRQRMDSLRSDLDERIRRTRGGIPARVAERSIAYGDRVAQHILAWASEDHYLRTRGEPKYGVTPTPGRWVPTPPAYMDAVEPHWGELRPFVMDSGSQYRPQPALAFDLAKASPYSRQLREVYETGKHLTHEQRAIASFWDCNPYVMNVQGHTMFATKKVTPGGHWMGITAIAARKAGADLMRSAEAHARTAIALADGFISAWEEKYHSSRIRPETVINNHVDARWEPLLQTPPFPEYPSAHSVISTAAAIVLTDEFGSAFAFVDSTEAEFGLPSRSFSSFKEAAAEAALSRLYGGIHYRQAIEEGAAEGRRVGELVLRRVSTRADRATPAAAASLSGR
jgi:membrane-associated phospholipid phosphatase